MRRFHLICLLLVALAGCGDDPQKAPSLAEAFVGPVNLNLRADIPLESPTVATVKHGDRVEIIQRRRRFMKVRTAGGAEGWTHERQLLHPDEMARLRQLAERASKLPAQGESGTLEALNVHYEPARQSPGFYQLKEGEKAEVLAYATMPRVEPERRPLIPPRPKRTPVRKKKEVKALARPAAPKPPSDWQERAKPAPPPEPEKPVPYDDWALIRLKDRRVGWVLASRLYMAIPDEVAQYAEGHRITGYFSLGEVLDGGQAKHHWLWTTSSRSLQPYDFDGFRVFIWNLRRHRYETSHRERDLMGFFPVHLQKVEYGGGSYPGFSICVKGEDGAVRRRAYAFIGNIVRRAGEGPCEVKGRADWSPGETMLVASGQAGTRDNGPSLPERVRRRLRDWLKR